MRGVEMLFLAVALVAVVVALREWRWRMAANRRVVALSHLEPELAATRAEREELAEEATRAAILESVDEQRAALLRSVSHDLRTPLATVRAVVSDLLSGTSHDDATRHELLSLVADETERLDRLVANLLSLSRIEAGALRPDRQALSMDELVAGVVHRLHRVFADRRVEVDVPDDLPLVDGDHTLVEQVLANVFENAARHAPPGSTIRIGARPVKDGVETWVDDEGAGIPPFERHRIFEPFRRSEGSGSSGVGLAICKAVVEAHGGRIVAEESPSGGARFRFTLPVTRTLPR